MVPPFKFIAPIHQTPIAIPKDTPTFDATPVVTTTTRELTKTVVIGPLDVTTTELFEAALNALRLTALGLAFAASALQYDDVAQGPYV